MQIKMRGIDRNTWMLIIAFLPVYLSTANGTLFNRQNPAAKTALDPYLHVLAICSLLIVVVWGLWRFRRNE